MGEVYVTETSSSTGRDDTSERTNNIDVSDDRSITNFMKYIRI